MKVKGDEQTGFLGTTQGTPANFTLRLSGDGQTRVELPIDPTSWEEGFQEMMLHQWQKSNQVSYSWLQLQQ